MTDLPHLLADTQVYSPEGFERVRTTEGIKDLLMRHFPSVSKQIPDGMSGFKPWGVSES